jgi:hypothetical protein
MRKSYLRKFYAGLLVLACLVLFMTCKQIPAKQISNADILHQNQEKLTDVIIYDVFSPPVVSRIYAYSSLASYEAIRFAKPGYPSIAARLSGFKPLPQPLKGKEYNYPLAATKAFFTVVHKVVFSLDSLKGYEENVFSTFRSLTDDSTYSRSLAFGDSIGKVILSRASTDNYISSRGKPKFIGSNDLGKWRPTPPDYLDAVESCWGSMSAFVIDSSFLQDHPSPVKYDMRPGSSYYKQVEELYKASRNLTVEQKQIARFWDDNPFVIEHYGHTMFANKKITPGGHWMGIAAIASKQSKADVVKTAQAYALTAIAMFDSFICCWDLKYKVNAIRPVTVINESIDRKWQPLLQTPPFPEYPSGHSTITRAAATVLTHLYGDNFAFQDTSDMKYIGMKRNFKSFIHAADEASISRFYGGIHYRKSVDDGAMEGQKVGEALLEKLNLSPEMVASKKIK